MEGSAPGGGCRGVWFGAAIGCAGRRREDVARQDRRADAHERFFIRCAQQSRPSERKAMIDRSHALPIAKQAQALGISRGSVYLAAVVDWFSRRVLSWRVSVTLEAAFCVEALEEALARHGRPEIFNTDQGSQFTSHDFTGVLLKAGIAISMDGRGSWRDNVFVERLWRSIKYEEVYLRAYETVSDARASIGRYLAFYNGRRPHSSLDRQTPDQAYFDRQPQPAAA